MEPTITKDILRNKFFAGGQPIAELLYNQYSGMLFSYILQFTPDRGEAGNLLVDVFSRLVPQLQRAFDSSLSIYCWLQVESRKIVLEHLKEKGAVSRQDGGAGYGDGYAGCGRDNAGYGLDNIGYGHDNAGYGRDNAGYYFSLLADASPEHQWVFRELFINGQDKERVAIRAGRDLAYVNRIMRECLLLIRKNLG